MKTVPTIWDDTVLEEGYPVKYAVVARRQGKEIRLPILAGKRSGYTEIMKKASLIQLKLTYRKKVHYRW